MISTAHARCGGSRANCSVGISEEGFAQVEQRMREIDNEMIAIGLTVATLAAFLGYRRMARNPTGSPIMTFYPTMSPYVPQPHDIETFPFIVRRHGVRWRVYRVFETHSDNAMPAQQEPVRFGALTFFRWIMAARVASELQAALRENEDERSE